MSKDAINGKVWSSIVCLTPCGTFNLIVTYVESYKKSDYLIDVRLAYGDKYKSNSYIETKYFFNVIGLFANRDNYLIDNSNFRTQYFSVNKKDIKFLVCKIFNNYVEDGDEVRLDMAMAKTMYETFRDITYYRNKKLLLENKLCSIDDVFMVIEPNINKSNRNWKATPVGNYLRLENAIEDEVDSWIKKVSCP